MSLMSTEPQYDVLWPLAEKAHSTREGAPRLADLSGVTVAELWDTKFHGETIFAQLREHLRGRFPGIRFVEYTEFGNFYGPREAEILGGLAEKLQRLECGAVITGIGA
jgi:hypothetical protein